MKGFKDVWEADLPKIGSFSLKYRCVKIFIVSDGYFHQKLNLQKIKNLKQFFICVSENVANSKLDDKLPIQDF